MARLSILAIAASITTLLLPATLARPFERPGWGVEEHHGPRPWWSPTATTHHTYTLTENPTSTITATISSAPQANTSCLTTWPSIPNPNCLPINPHCVLPYPTSWFCFGGAATAGTGTGIGTGVSTPSIPVSSEALPASFSSQVQAGTTTDVVPTPTGSAPSFSIPVSASTFPSATGIPPTGVIPPSPSSAGTGIIPTGTATATALHPPLPTLLARDYQALALQKRKLFEGPRRRDFPHFWPVHNVDPNLNLELAATPTAPTQVTGTGVMGTGVVGTTIITASTHAFSIPSWPWTFPTGTGTGILTLPIESGIGGPVPVPTGV